MRSVEEGNRRLAAGDWDGACAAFRDALAQAEDPDALFGLGEALWWLGDFRQAVELRERAYSEYQRRSDPMNAASVAIRLCIDYRASLGNATASDGWLARLTRLIEEHELEPLRGWLLLMRASTSATAAEGEKHARDAYAWARDTGDRDIELCSLSEVGAMLVKRGEVRRGISWLDEAMAGSLGGEAADPDTVVFTSCNMVLSCAACAEIERVVNWVRAADRFMERYGCLFLRSVCRAAYGRVLLATGDWARAESEVDAALESSRGSPLYVLVLAVLAELRVAQGRLDEAAQLLEGFEDLGPTAPVLASLQLARGEPALARATVRRQLSSVGDQHLGEALLTELLGEAELALGEADTARECGEELARRGASFGCAMIEARGERLCGRALASTGEPVAARQHLERALVAFARLEMPLETARTRLALASALADLEPDVAAAEAQSATVVCEDLGANRDADRATSLLRRLGVKSARRGPRGRDISRLTKREREVLGLLGQGLSNPDIAARLFISRKTVEHHVAKILAKLGLRNRAQAAAEAMRQRGEKSAPR